MIKKLNLKVLVAITIFFASCFMTGCQEEKLNDTDIVDSAILSFEKKYAASLSSENDAIKLIGFKTVYVPDNERAEFVKFVSEYEDFLSNETGLYIEPDCSSYRLYFALHTAIIKCDGDEYMADEKGLIKDNIKNIERINIIGRKKSDVVCGTGNNIILNDRILFRKKLKQGGERKPMLGYAIKECNTCVFDLGERAMHRHNRDHINCSLPRLKEGPEKTEEGVSCYRNHNNKTCSEAFSINEGRCEYLTGICMDYNGPDTDCVNSAKNFTGSDCYYAMLRFHCWNEIK
jgi:hypothetical protein